MNVEQIVLAALGGSLSVLIIILGWIGANVHRKLDDLNKGLEEKLGSMASTLRGIEKDLRGELSNLDRRISHVEGRIKAD